MVSDLRTVCAAATLLLALFFSAESRAEPHARDGFYLQMATGFGAYFYSSTQHFPFYEPPIDGTDLESGPSLGGSLLLGLPLRPGLVLGAGGLLATAWTNGPHLTRNGEPITIENGGGPYVQIIGIAGPFVDCYPSRRFGWHVQALAGYASFVAGNTSLDRAPKGFGLMAGVGQDWWISDRWSVGFLARLSYANTRLGAARYPDSNGGSPSLHDTVLSPSLEASFTYH